MNATRLSISVLCVCLLPAISAVAQEKKSTSQRETVARPMTEKERKKKEEKLRKELETPYRKWLNEDVAYIITDEERQAFKRLQTDEEREQFIEQFWLRRDPTPDTVENEFTSGGGCGDGPGDAQHAGEDRGALRQRLRDDLHLRHLGREADRGGRRRLGHRGAEKIGGGDHRGVPGSGQRRPVPPALRLDRPQGHRLVRHRDGGPAALTAHAVALHHQHRADGLH